MSEKNIIDLDALDQEILDCQQRLIKLFNERYLDGDEIGSRLNRIRRHRLNIENELRSLREELERSVDDDDEEN